MQEILEQLEQIKGYKEELRRWCKINGLKVSFSNSISLSKAKCILQRLKKTQTHHNDHYRTRWMENELKLFHFSLLALSAISKLPISQFVRISSLQTPLQWHSISAAFPNKNLHLLQFGAANFVARKEDNKRKWTAHEDQMLTQLVKDSQEELKWNDIAVQMFVKSQGEIFRLGKQCRERWLNHLDSKIMHDKWTEEDDVELIKNVAVYGKKWSQIMKQLSFHRTEHMIKNRFISLVLRYKRAHPFCNDEEHALRGIILELGIDINSSCFLEAGRQNRYCDKSRSQSDSRLAPVQPRDEIKQGESENLDESIQQKMPDYPVKIEEDENCGKPYQVAPTPTSFMSPVQLYPCPSFFGDINFVQWCFGAYIGNQ